MAECGLGPQKPIASGLSRGRGGGAHDHGGGVAAAEGGRAGGREGGRPGAPPLRKCEAEKRKLVFGTPELGHKQAVFKQLVGLFIRP